MEVIQPTEIRRETAEELAARVLETVSISGDRGVAHNALSHKLTKALNKYDWTSSRRFNQDIRAAQQYIETVFGQLGIDNSLVMIGPFRSKPGLDPDLPEHLGLAWTSERTFGVVPAALRGKPRVDKRGVLVHEMIHCSGQNTIEVDGAGNVVFASSGWMQYRDIDETPFYGFSLFEEVSSAILEYGYHRSIGEDECEVIYEIETPLNLKSPLDIAIFRIATEINHPELFFALHKEALDSNWFKVLKKYGVKNASVQTTFSQFARPNMTEEDWENNKQFVSSYSEVLASMERFADELFSHMPKNMRVETFRTELLRAKCLGERDAFLGLVEEKVGSEGVDFFAVLEPAHDKKDPKRKMRHIAMLELFVQARSLPEARCRELRRALSMMAQHDMELIEDRFTAYLDETTRNALIPAHLNLMRSENIYRRFADFAFIEREV